MKKLWGLLLLLFCLNVRAQQVAVSCDNVNIFYEVIPNPISIAVENVSASRLIVETDNGVINKSVDGGYSIGGLKAGTAHLTIKQKTGNITKLIGTKTFKVKTLPLPVVLLGGKNGGSIKIAVLKAQAGLICRFEGFDFDAVFKITRFTMSIVRNGNSVYNEKVMGNRFSDKALRLFNAVQVNDLLIFSDIYFVGSSGLKRKLNDIEFKIVP